MKLNKQTKKQKQKTESKQSPPPPSLNPRFVKALRGHVVSSFSYSDAEPFKVTSHLQRPKNQFYLTTLIQTFNLTFPLKKILKS